MTLRVSRGLAVLVGGMWKILEWGNSVADCSSNVGEIGYE